MRKAAPATLALLAAGALALWACQPPTGSGEEPRRFHLSGVVSVAGPLHTRTERPNSVLFIVASNAAGIPVAMKRTVNPKLPLKYEMNEEDLVLPGPVWKGSLSVKAQLSTHGQAGLTLHGDLTGSHPGSARNDDGGVDIRIDREN
ncbi:MAG: hypothetical protein WC969_07840 [Elusimicrobiota bacterium]